MRIPSIIRQDSEYKASVQTLALQLLAKTPLPIIINGLSGGSADAYLIEAVREAREMSGAPVAIFVGNDQERTRVASLLGAWGLDAREFKPRDLVFHNVSASCDIDRERLSVLLSVRHNECDAVVTTPSAALGYTMPRAMLDEGSLLLTTGMEISRDTLCDKLVSLGFARVDMVEAAGQFSVRGDIVDIWYQPTYSPTRVEFFGDEIDRMSCFDHETQRSVGVCESFLLIPAREVVMDKDASARVKSEIDRLIKRAESNEAKDKLSSERAIVDSGLLLDSRDRYISIIYKERESLLDYLSDLPRVAAFVLGTNENKENVNTRLAYLRDTAKELAEQGLISESSAKYSGTLADFDDFLAKNVPIHINAFAGGVGNMRAAGLFGFRTRRATPYGGNPSLLFEDVLAFRKGLYRTLILTENKQGADSLIASLAESDISAQPVYDNPDFDISACDGGRVLVGVGSFEGFELIAPKIAVLSMARPEGRVLMEKRRQKRILKKVGGAGQKLMSYADLSLGDYVVHANYGIGLFEGIETVTVDGITKDYITIKYAGTDKLFVPCDRLELIGKYIGKKDDNGTVKLSKMGGGDWGRAKSRAKSAAKDIAKDLIRLYAERQRTPGFAFPADSELEDEFAASFEYEETESQLVAIEEIKRDMMQPVPMNRLLCGDVGFGKTEVALRAAFKAIMGGKQVAILVPTTILALQHLETAISRMRNYPVTIEMISRFRTPTQQEKILRKVARGEVDILIGTHKLLSSKVKFRDLGLLIIDEEQRFGVAQKEKLKQMAKNVDVLTLSATPIPRTLNMAMNGISDMSILDEAPGERRPVQTYVLEYDEAVIYDAMRRELARGGQVFYIYNKIEDIDMVATRIMKALPDARVAVAHGAMDKDEIEDIWQALVKAEIDILVSTTIIETGVDLPSANTLIIENADRMGLSQLHQIRGRVGRSERQAYAYFTFRQGKALSDIARKRLVAIREFAIFGAGFKVALRDLEIRGAGNLLGAEQHGYIESVGYDLYIKLLSEAVLEESGRANETPFESVVDIRVSANIPDKYISVNAQRMEMYKKISLICDTGDAEDILDEFIDRFGEPPRETENLIKISLVRSLASACRISKVEFTNQIIFHLERMELGIWSELFGQYPALAFRAALTPSVTYKLMKGDKALDVAISVLTEYKRLLSEEAKGAQNEEK